MIEIVNLGPLIQRTNYFDTEMAAAGYFYLSFNAGAARLLVPDARHTMLEDMRAANDVILSEGFWTDHDRVGVEVLFEDGSDSPFCLHLSVNEQTDRRLPEADQGGGLRVTAWTRAGQVGDWRGRYRRVERIPYLEPWTEH